MNVFRITRAKYAKDISGTGARLYGGRWNPKGLAVLYTAESRALAALELLVHLPPHLLPEDIKLITLEVPDDLLVETWLVSELPQTWRRYPASDELAAMGEKWVLSGKSLILKVPSVIIPQEFNILINPIHEAFDRVEILTVEDFRIDDRLVK